MAIHSSTLAWKIPWMEEPDRLQSIGSQTIEKLHFHFQNTGQIYFINCTIAKKDWTKKVLI